LEELRGDREGPAFDVTVISQTSAGENDERADKFATVRRPSAVQLFRLIRSHDVIHVAGPAILPLVIGLLLRKPLVIEHHGFQTICPNGQLLIEPAGTPCPGHFMLHHHGECLRCNSAPGWWHSVKLWALTFFRRWLCRRVAVNIAPTAWLGELIRLPQVTAIPHGIERRAVCKETQMPGHAPLIAFQGRLVSTKGVGVLLEAARILSEKKQAFELVIIGDGPERQTLEELSRQWQIDERVRFLGRLASADAEAVLSRAFAVVVPSLGGEVFGLVVVENMQRGIPLVASDLGAFVEVVGKCGVTFRTGDAISLAKALCELMERPEQAAELGRNGARRVEEAFGLERMIGAHADVYRSIAPK
jgi:glycosyltransferase involved in cell wall biosynthesis